MVVAATVYGPWWMLLPWNEEDYRYHAVLLPGDGQRGQSDCWPVRLYCGYFMFWSIWQSLQPQYCLPDNLLYHLLQSTVLPTLA